MKHEIKRIKPLGLGRIDFEEDQTDPVRQLLIRADQLRLEGKDLWDWMEKTYEKL